MNLIVITVLAGVIDGMGMVIAVYVLIAIILFLVLREVACWYWKINERKALMEEQNELLKELIEMQKKEIEA